MPLTETDIHALETQLATLIGPEFVDQARTVLPQLFAEIRELRSERDEMRAGVAEARRILEFIVSMNRPPSVDLESFVFGLQQNAAMALVNIPEVEERLGAATEGGQNVRATDRRATAGD